MSTAQPPIVLTFAGTDPTGGAGLQADVLTLAALGCHPLSVVTAITAQDTSGVAALEPLEASWVSRQAREVLEDMRVDAFKIGVVASAENAEAIAAVLERYPDTPVVLDPVLASGRGDALAVGDVCAALLRTLVPRATLLTPNSIEVRALAARAGCNNAAIEACARALIAARCGHVLVTGTHEETEQVVNTLYGPAGFVRRDAWQRLPADYHGSGCTLASACAAYLARGFGIERAVAEAQAFTWRSLVSGFRPGRGQHLPLRRAAHDADG